MRKILITVLIIGMVFALVACGSDIDKLEVVEAQIQETTTIEMTEELAETVEKALADNLLETIFKGTCPYKEQYEIWDITTEVFSDDILADLGADGFTGTDKEIAQQIYDWQANNMDYAGPMDNFFDAGFGARWNMVIPGIYPASKRIIHKTDDDKVYGICSDFAYIYIAIANAYGLESRVTTYTFDAYENIYGCLPLMFQDEESNRGMNTEEYDLLNVELKANGIDLTYDQLYRAMQGRSTVEGHIQGPHNRAEVLLDGKWVAFDATKEFSDFSYIEKDHVAENYTKQNWDGIYNPIRLYAPTFQDSAVPNAPIDYLALGKYIEYGPQVVYTLGITDDYGNENRAYNFTSFVRGDAYLPYVDSVEKLANFLHMDVAEFADEEYDEFLVEASEGLGREYNIIADFIIYDDEMDGETFVPYYNAITGDNLTLDEFHEYIE